MQEILRLADPVTISFVEALLRDAGIHFHVADRGINAIEGGSNSAFPSRVLVLEEDAPTARQLLIDAGLEAELRPPSKSGLER